MSTNPHRAVLFANGELNKPNAIPAILEEADVIIAVDGGLRFVSRLGLVPDVIIGDLDSADPEAVARYGEQGVDVQKFPRDKNETDLELALSAALEMGATAILVVAALGGRLDQSLANLFLLTRPDLSSLDVRLVDGEREVFLVQGQAVITGQPCQRVSLIPLCSPVMGIRTTGLKYPLRDETLYPDKTRGISNQMTAASARITLREGILLCIHETSDPTSTVAQKGTRSCDR